MQVICVHNLAKRYGQRTVLQGIDLSVEQGEYVAILGANGSGKTTLIRAVAGLTLPDEGTVSFFGQSSSDRKVICSHLGVVHQHSALPEYVTVRELLSNERRLRGLDEATVDKAIDLAGLHGQPPKLIRELSEGTRRRVAVVRALLHDPAILLLDEPTAGLDPLIRMEIWEHLLHVKRKGCSALIATNDLQEAAQLCDRMFFLRSGCLYSANGLHDAGSMAELYKGYAALQK